MTQEEIDGLKPGDAIYHVFHNPEVDKVSIHNSSPMYVRMFIGDKVFVSHSMSCDNVWGIGKYLFCIDGFCLRKDIEKAVLKIATRVLSDRISHAEQVFKEAKAEFEAIGETTPNSMIDFESLKNAK